MTRDDLNRFDIGFPAPGASKVGAVMLWVGFFLAPAAWSVQLAATGTIAGLACLEGSRRAADQEWGWAGWSIEAVNLLALAVAVGAILLALFLIRRTREAEPKPQGGVMRAGEGRARFMAVWGLFTSVLFFFAIGFNTVSVFWGGLCPV